MNDSHSHAWTQDHVYLGEHHSRAEARTRLVVYLTAVFMVVEIVAGLVFGSMALLADGVHMATHVGALGLAAWAYWMARRHARNRYFSFGSGKFGDLAGFASALILGIIAIGVAVESVVRLYNPIPIQYTEAMVVAVIGLGVNIVSAFMLHDDHRHGHAHDDDDDHDDHADHDHDHHHDHHGHEDHNLRAAYVHVLADAATSLLALAALGLGAAFGWQALDPLVGILGALVISRWALHLLKQTGLVLLDVEDHPGLARDIRKTLEDDLGLQVADLHLWRLGPGHRGLIVSLVSAAPCTSAEIKDILRARHKGLSHVTIEVDVCEECAPPQTTKAAE